MNHPGQDVLDDMLSSGGDPRDMAHVQLTSVRNLLLDSFYTFCKLIFGYNDLDPKLHGEVCAFVEKWGREPEGANWPRLMIQIPRECFKTSVCTRANALWQVCRWFYRDSYLGTDATVAIFNEREANSQKWLRNIKEVVMNSSIFKEVFKDLLPPGVYQGKNPLRWKWSDTEIDFQKKSYGQSEASITALGITSATTGGHWTHIIKDDILSFDASRSEIVMQTVRDWVDASRDLERPGRMGLDLIACTPWHYNDAYRYILETYGDEYHLLRRSALEVDPKTGREESIFPTKWTTDFLKRERKRNPYQFNAQMQCRPMAGKEMSFREEWLRFGSIQRNSAGEEVFRIANRFYDPTIHAPDIPDGDAPQEVPIHWMHIFHVLDPAPSEETDINREGTSARNALVTIAIDPWGRLYLLDVWADRVEATEVLRKIFVKIAAWEQNRFACEHVCFSKLYRPFLEYIRKTEFRNVQLSYFPLKPGRRDKDTRILSMIPGYRSGLWYWNQDVVASALREFNEFPHSATKDILDAMSYHSEVLKRPESPGEYEERIGLGMVEQREDQQLTYDSWTGY